MTRKKRCIGVYLFGALFIVSSLFQMKELAFRYEWYMDIYHYMPERIVFVRYLFSWFQRFVGISIGIGLLYRKNIFRIAAIALGVFAICTIHLKHPYEGFVLHIQHMMKDPYVIRIGGEVILARIKEAANILNIPHSYLIWAMVIFYRVIDTLFYIVLIFYFTRPKVIAYFKPDFCQESSSQHENEESILDIQSVDHE